MSVMVKKRKPVTAAQPTSTDKPASLKDLLSPDVVNKLKAQADLLQAERDKQLEEARRQAEEARKAEKKRQDNDFGHLLENSGMDWRKYK